MDKIIELAQQEEAQKFQNFIDPNDTDTILAQAQAQGVKFTQLDLDTAVNQTNREWIAKVLLDPQEVKTNLTLEWERDELEKQHDNHPNITLTEQEELTEPGIAEKIIKKIFQNYPVESAASTAGLGYLAQKYLQKWRNIPQVEQLEKEQKELEEAGERLLNAYYQKDKEWVELGEKQKDLENEKKTLTKRVIELKRDLKSLAQKAEQELIASKIKKYAEYSILKGEYITLETNYNSCSEIKSDLYQKLNKIKKNQIAQGIKAENICRDLVLYRSISDNLENPTDNSLEESLTNSTEKLIDIVAETQQYLGVKDLTKITTSHKMPPGKGLKDLIDFYLDNKDKSPTAPSQPPIITKLELEESNETVIVNQIISECDLGLNENSSLTSVINRIKKLIKIKPPIIKPVNQPTDTPFGESLTKIIQIDLNSFEKELGINLSRRVKEQIEKATNYQELSNIRNQEIKSYLEKGRNTGITALPSQQVIRPEKERIIWISLLMISLMVIGGLVVKITRLKKKNKSLV